MAKRILVAVIFVPLLLVIMLLLPPIVWTVVVMLISAVACFELLRAAGERKVSLPMEAVSVLSAAALPLAVWAGMCSILAMRGGRPMRDPLSRWYELKKPFRCR